MLALAHLAAPATLIPRPELSEPQLLFNVSRAFWITVNTAKETPDLWPSLRTERFLGLRGSQNLSKFLTPRGKQSLQYGRESGKELPSWNAVALCFAPIDCDIQEDAAIQSGTVETLKRIDQIRLASGNESWFSGERIFLTLDAFGVKDFGCKYDPIIFPESKYIKELACHLWYGTSSYILNYGAAQELLERALPIDMQIDAYLATHAISQGRLNGGKIRFAQTAERLYKQQYLSSNVQKVDAYAIYDWKQVILLLVLGTAVPCFGIGYALGWYLKANSMSPRDDMKIKMLDYAMK
eukprot:754554-Hanusia_phi.AAC.2